MLRLIPWLVGLALLGFVGWTWLESREQGKVERFVERMRHGDEGTLEKAGRKMDEAVDEVVEDVKREARKKLED